MSVCNIKQSSWINSARGVTQIELNVNGNPRLVTIIGELHQQEFDCSEKGSSMSIYEYCLERAISNPNCKFLFEYNHENTHDFRRIGSKIIQDVFTSGENQVKSRSKGIDIRLSYITMCQQQHLYNDIAGFRSKYNNIGKIREDYVKQYQTKIKENPLSDPTESSLQDDLQQYIQSIDQDFKKYTKEIPSLMDLRWLWSRFMDYQILWEISNKLDDSNEYIIVVGENHRKNISDTITNWKSVNILTEYSNNHAGECVNIKKLKGICKF